ncbi:hypothetical protein PQR62_12265 [Herbaspirillum lusitanum]|uniref:PLD phosphodiesterase domain-containing protein n=1 Tax=Herbaspirillum lusitanum TaxID=213312 RepID=A0ABW9A8F4_9BURK
MSIAYQHRPLPELFADLAIESDQDPIQQLLALTFEFDDRQLLNLMAGVPLNDDSTLSVNRLRFLDGCQPTVVYDASNTSAFNALPHFMNLLPVKAAPYSCHHAKAYLVITGASMRLVLGSFNLTRTGLSRNREVFAEFEWRQNSTGKPESHADADVWRDFAAILEKGYRGRGAAQHSAELASAAATIRGRVADVAGGQRVLIASGFSHLEANAAIDQLAALWRSRHRGAPVEVVAVSPFFDQASSYLIDDLVARIGVPASMRVVTGAKEVGNLSQRHFGKAGGGLETRYLHLIHADMSAQERRRIAVANDIRDGTVMLEARALHAKVIVLCGEQGKNNLYYIGSANFTRKAWLGDNQELGVAWFEDGASSDVARGLMEGVSADPANHYDTLPAVRIQQEREEDRDYAGGIAYPEFILRITLHGSEALQFMQFHFETHPDQPASFDHYRIQWGRHVLEVSEMRSQAFPWAAASSVLLQRENLHFQPLEAPDIAGYYLPYILQDGLREQADLVLFPDPEAWLAYYLNPYSGVATGGPDERLPNDAGGEDGDYPDREANPVIAMQRYLNLFADTEAALIERARLVAGREPLSETGYRRHFGKPLTTFLCLLDREQARMRKHGESQMADMIWLFKAGELLGLCRKLGESLPLIKELVNTLEQRIAACGSSGNNAMQSYAHYQGRARS